MATTNKTSPEQTGTPPEEDFELENAVGYPPLAFTGVLLAEDTSRRVSESFTTTRWTEIALYRVTQGQNAGLYVLEIVGMSDVYHLVGAPCPGSVYGKDTPPDELPEEFVPCDKCNPPGIGDEQPMPPLLVVEVDLPQLYEYDTPKAVLDKLRERGGGSLSSVARRIVLAASKVDEGIREALRVPRRI